MNREISGVSSNDLVMRSSVENISVLSTLLVLIS